MIVLYTPIHGAVLSKNVSIVQYLVENNAEIDAKDSNINYYYFYGPLSIMQRVLVI